MTRLQTEHAFGDTFRIPRPCLCCCRTSHPTSKAFLLANSNPLPHSPHPPITATPQVDKLAVCVGRAPIFGSPTLTLDATAKNKPLRVMDGSLDTRATPMMMGTIAALTMGCDRFPATKRSTRAEASGSNACRRGGGHGFEHRRKATGNQGGAETIIATVTAAAGTVANKQWIRPIRRTKQQWI